MSSEIISRIVEAYRMRVGRAKWPGPRHNPDKVEQALEWIAETDLEEFDEGALGQELGLTAQRVRQLNRRYRAAERALRERE